MKKYQMIAFVFILFLTMTAAAQEIPASFRNDATGGALLDDLDLVYDPVELSFVNGIRLFTNLTNVIDTNEEILNNRSNNQLLLGISGPVPIYPKMKASLLWQYKNATSPNFVSINSDMTGLSDLSGKGDLFDHFSSYQDIDSDGFIDSRTQIDQEVHDNTTNKNYNVVLTGSMPVSEMIVAGRINMGMHTYNGTTADITLGSGMAPFEGAPYGSPTFGRSIFYQDLNDAFIPKKISEHGDFFSERKSSFFEVVLAGMKKLDLPFGESEGRVDIKYNKTTDEINATDLYSAHQKFFDRDNKAYDKNNSESDELSTGQKNNGSNIGIALDLKRVFLPGTERRYDGFWRVRMAYDRISTDYVDRQIRNFSSNDFFFDGTDTLGTDIKKVYETNDIEQDVGDLNTNGITLVGLTNIPLGDRVFFGIGATWSLFSTSRETQYGLQDSDSNTYEIMDDTSTVADKVTTNMLSTKADRTFETKVTSFSIPVGIEYTFTDSMRWRIRFGALFSCQKTVTNDAKQITESFPNITRMETGDGAVSIDEAENEYQSTSVHSESITTETYFTYGIGYQPTPNLQIDLLGFLGGSNSIIDADFYKRLRLSFTIRM